jgi:hypothetical protein
MTPRVRSVVAVVLTWLVTAGAIALGGYLLATSGMIGEIATESSRSGKPPEEVAALRLTTDRAYAQRMLRSMETTQRLIDWAYLPGIAIAIGATLGLSSKDRRAPLLVLGLAPFAAFTISLSILPGIVHSAMALASAWVLLAWKQRKAAQ